MSTFKRTFQASIVLAAVSVLGITAAGAASAAPLWQATGPASCSAEIIGRI